MATGDLLALPAMGTPQYLVRSSSRRECVAEDNPPGGDVSTDARSMGRKPGFPRWRGPGEWRTVGRVEVALNHDGELVVAQLITLVNALAIVITIL